MDLLLAVVGLDRLVQHLPSEPRQLHAVSVRMLPAPRPARVTPHLVPGAFSPDTPTPDTKHYMLSQPDVVRTRHHMSTMSLNAQFLRYTRQLDLPEQDADGRQDGGGGYLVGVVVARQHAHHMVLHVDHLLPPPLTM